MNKNLEELLDVLKTQSAINVRIERILSFLISGNQNNPQLNDLREMIKNNQSSLSDLEKKIKSSEE